MVPSAASGQQLPGMPVTFYSAQYRLGQRLLAPMTGSFRRPVSRLQIPKERRVGHAKAVPPILRRRPAIARQTQAPGRMKLLRVLLSYAPAAIRANIGKLFTGRRLAARLSRRDRYVLQAHRASGWDAAQCGVFTAQAGTEQLPVV